MCYCNIGKAWCIQTTCAWPRGELCGGLAICASPPGISLQGQQVSCVSQALSVRQRQSQHRQLDSALTVTVKLTMC